MTHPIPEHFTQKISELTETAEHVYYIIIALSHYMGENIEHDLGKLALEETIDECLKIFHNMCDQESSREIAEKQEITPAQYVYRDVLATTSKTLLLEIAKLNRALYSIGAYHLENTSNGHPITAFISRFEMADYVDFFEKLQEQRAHMYRTLYENTHNTRNHHSPNDTNRFAAKVLREFSEITSPTAFTAEEQDLDCLSSQVIHTLNIILKNYNARMLAELGLYNSGLKSLEQFTLEITVSKIAAKTICEVVDLINQSYKAPHIIPLDDHEQTGSEQLEALNATAHTIH